MCVMSVRCDVCRVVHARAHLWRSEGNFVELVLSFHLSVSVSSRHQSDSGRWACQASTLPTEHLVGHIKVDPRKGDLRLR